MEVRVSLGGMGLGVGDLLAVQPWPSPRHLCMCVCTPACAPPEFKGVCLGTCLHVGRPRAFPVGSFLRFRTQLHMPDAGQALQVPQWAKQMEAASWSLLEPQLNFLTLPSARRRL
jgi:hypothetical protein